jgi:hypothetical protein
MDESLLYTIPVRPLVQPLRRELRTVVAADRNACLRVERAKASDGMTASERAMTSSAKKMPVTEADAKEAVKDVVVNDPKATEAAKVGAKKPSAKKDVKPKRISALNAAAQVLEKAGTPMRSQEMIVAMAEQGLW